MHGTLKNSRVFLSRVPAFFLKYTSLFSCQDYHPRYVPCTYVAQPGLSIKIFLKSHIGYRLKYPRFGRENPVSGRWAKSSESFYYRGKLHYVSHKQ